MRRRAAAHAGVAALRNDRHARLGADAHDGGDFVGGARAHDGARGAAVAAAPVDEIRFGVGGRRQDVRRADDAGEAGEQGCAGIGHGAGY